VGAPIFAILNSGTVAGDYCILRIKYNSNNKYDETVKIIKV
jgi:hypothetical protein